MNRLCLLGVLVVLFSLGRPATAGSLGLVFNHTFGDEALSLDRATYQTGAKEKLRISRLSYLLSGFALQREDGSWREMGSLVAWNDAGRGRTRVNLDELAAENYLALRFSVGLGEDDNLREVSDYPADHPLNPNVNGLHWSWQTGYIFIAIEGHYNQDQGFSYHLARAPHRTWIQLPTRIDLTSGNKLLVIDFDIAALLNAPHALSFAVDGASTHSREGDPTAAKLADNLQGAMRLHQVIDLGPGQRAQKKKPPLYLPAERTAYELHFNRRLPLPQLPEDNPLFVERMELGRKLFHDPMLSRNHEMACATCHEAQHALTDPRRFSVGIDGQVGQRNAMPLFNLGWKSHFFWDGRAPSLREQALIPIEDPIEMAASLPQVIARLQADPVYPKLFAAAFDPPEITPEKLGLAVEQFLLGQISYRSRYDRAIQGLEQLNEQEQRGFMLFVTEYEPRSGQYGADCFHCHGGTLFSDHQFHNNGLVPGADLGRFAVTGAENDRYRFVTPSLRNVAVTAPYMHDGRFATLEEVVAHYNHGVQRSPTLDPNLAKHPPGGLGLSPEDQRALVAFLNTLTDREFLGE